MAWPWDKDPIEVTGDLTCNNFDFSSDKPQFWGAVQGFEIRGKDHVLRQAGHGYLATYKVSVPSGWKVEWSIKCSGQSEWVNGSFGVDNTVLGTSSKQRRNICSPGAGLLPKLCPARDLGACVTTVLMGPVPIGFTFEEAVTLAGQLQKGDTSLDGEKCLAAIRREAPKLSAVPAPPKPPKATPLPVPDTPTYHTKAPVPVPDDDTSGSSTGSASGGAGSSGGSGQQHSNGSSGSVSPGSTGTGPETPEAETTRTITISNLVTMGSSMRDDPNSPAYLSAVTQNKCRTNGCMLEGTYMNTGATVTALCQTQGARTTNGNDSSSADDSNPGLYTSTLWYGAKWSDGRFGYISETWIAPGHRGGLGLPSC